MNMTTVVTDREHLLAGKRQASRIKTQGGTREARWWPRRTHLAWILGLFLAVYAGSLFSPPLLDDADATHANASRHMAETGDFVTLRVNGIRYLEKAPLPYWVVAAGFRVFGYDTFAVHLPLALSVLALALLAYRWGMLAWGDRAALYAASAVLTSVGVFLFTRVFIPEVLLSLFMVGTLYCVLRGLELRRRTWIYAAWTLLAFAVLTKGLVAIVFVGSALLAYGLFTGELRRWRELRLGTGGLLFLAIAAPWHILAGLRNTGGAEGHGFFWFYFVNEHWLRFLGRRMPHDYNKLPGWLYWSLHLVWLFPWSLLWPAVAIAAWRERSSQRGFAWRSFVLLGSFTGIVLIFFAMSTNQEYYTYPVYMPLALLTMAGVVIAERRFETDAKVRRWFIAGHAVLTVVGAGVALALAGGLWQSRKLPFVSDIGEMLAHRGVGDYTLSMSHFFDLTGPSFAALRLPAGLAMIAFAAGPGIAWWLRKKGEHRASTLTMALTSAVFLIAAHIALVRFGPMLSSQKIEARYEELMDSGAFAKDSELMLYGDQSYGSSIPFYAGETVPLVEGRSTSMWFGSTFPDAPKIFWTKQELEDVWGVGRRKVLFVPLEKRDEVDALLGKRQIVLMEVSGKALVTDRPVEGAGR
jgi:4-amino-4-deoxy-L-arabinose transferase-like glycosyltransferase